MLNSHIERYMHPSLTLFFYATNNGPQMGSLVHKTEIQTRDINRASQHAFSYLAPSQDDRTSALYSVQSFESS